MTYIYSERDRSNYVPLEIMAVRLKDGWVGQALWAGEIVVESRVYPDKDAAVHYVQHLLKSTFAMLGNSGAAVTS